MVTHLHSHIGKHFSTSFTGEGTVSLHPDILGTNSNISTESLLHLLDVNLRWADDDLGLGAQSRLVEHRNKLLSLLDGAIALPVSSNEELAGLNLGRRGVGTRGYLRKSCSNGTCRLHDDV